MVKKKFEKICMIGMPGSGKSTIGRALCDYLKFDFYDTDEQIEIESQSKIKDIFNKEGEERFRKLERSIFKKLILKKKIVVSTGGGIILKNVKSFAATNVDRISIGELTHSIQALDLKLEI